MKTKITGMNWNFLLCCLFSVGKIINCGCDYNFLSGQSIWLAKPRRFFIYSVIWTEMFFETCLYLVSSISFEVKLVGEGSDMYWLSLWYVITAFNLQDTLIWMFYFCSFAWWNTSLILITKFFAAPYLNYHRTLGPWVRSSLRSFVNCPLFVVMWTPCLRKRRLLFFLMTVFLRLVKSVSVKSSWLIPVGMLCTQSCDICYW